MNVKEAPKVKVLRIIPITGDWPQLRRNHPGTHSVALIELPGGELALIPCEQETPTDSRRRASERTPTP